MIQILGLREFVTDTGEVKLYDSHFGNGWRAESLPELFANIESYIEKIPEEYRYNLFYTMSRCEERKGRVFVDQNVLPIDIDDVDEPDQVIDCVLHTLGLPHDKVGLVDSGNGVHILIGLPVTITDVSYFKTNRVYYKALCGRINHALFEAGLRGTADPSVFSAARLMRLPYTENRKPNKGIKKCVVLNKNIEPLNVDLVSLADMPRVEEGDHIHPRGYARFPDPDTHAVQEQCGFLRYVKGNQEDVTEPQWYAMLSIVGRLDNGEQLVHEYSQQYSNYNPDQTDTKLEHALEASGPRTCENIDTLWDGCKDCPQWCKITSPIQLVGEDYLRTKDTGFYDVKIKNGLAVRDKPNYDDLVKFFGQQMSYFTDQNTEITYTFNGTHWVEIPKLKLHKFAEDHFKPTPNKSMCVEFESKIKRTNLKDPSFMNVEGKLNFLNGVLDIESMELSPHSEDYGFMYVIPYKYEVGDKCPRFDQFMDEVTQENHHKKDLILQFMGYCLSGLDPKVVQKCAIFYGGGSNGKSVLLDLLRELVGRVNASAVGMTNLSKDTGRYKLKDRMVNISDETPSTGFLESNDFKSIVSGDTLEVRRLYHDAVEWKSMTKLVFACNELPFTSDFSDGLYRRLIIVPFNAKFRESDGTLDPLLLDKLLKERSGILQKVLMAYKEFKANGYRFPEVDEIKRAKQEYRSMGDSIYQFVEEECSYKQGLSVPSRVAYRCYIAWCEDVKQRPSTYNVFCRRFGKHLAAMVPDVSSERQSHGKGKTRIYLDLCINADASF
jgi:P4 family phage/plasmid primase-like protien